MRMKASLGMVCEFCTMIQATSEQRLSSWHTDSNLDGQAARRVRDAQGASVPATSAFGASGSWLATSYGGTLRQAVRHWWQHET